MNIIERPIYINRIEKQLNRGLILVLVGQRRVGKSFLLKSLANRLTQNDPQANVLFIEKDFGRFNFIRTADDLYAYAIEKLPEGGKNYLLIDEVQDIAGYEVALRSLYAEERCQIVVTGSNAYMFSTEIATKFSGRYIEIPVRSLDYPEFLVFHNLTDSHESLIKYIQFGGMPGLANYRFDEIPEIKAYLQGVCDTVILKDVVTRENIRNVRFLENLLCFLADNAGQLVSVNSIVKYLKSQGTSLTNDATTKYINALCNALIIEPTLRYDIHGKRIFDLIGKYYFSDHGMRNNITHELPDVFSSIEKIIENIVRHHLLVQQFDVNVGILPSGEIDFVAKKGNQTIYIQVAYKLSGTDTIKREFGNLFSVADNYPKYVITMEDIVGPLPQYPGIIHLHLRDFLKLTNL